MKRIAKCFYLIPMVLIGCAGIKSHLVAEPDKTVQLTNPQTITVIIPKNKTVDSRKISQINFDERWGGYAEKQQKLNVKNKSNSSFSVDRRTDNGTSGSGIIYSVNYSDESDNNNTIIKFKPTEYKTYHEGLILPFAIPTFTEKDLADYIIKQPIFYNLEIESKYNTDSTYSNFVRLIEKVQFKPGEKDPVTGKIFKDKFAITYKDEKIYFSLEAYPYHNGSKVVMHLVVPGSFTSDNVVDFGVILKDIKTQLEGVVNS